MSHKQLMGQNKQRSGLPAFLLINTSWKIVMENCVIHGCKYRYWTVVGGGIFYG
jgi:hypothetical protein